MLDAFDTHAGDGRPRNPGEQRSAEGVAQGIAEARLEWLNDESRSILVDHLFLDLRTLDDQHGRTPYFEYNSTISCSWTWVSICTRFGRLVMVILRASVSTSIHSTPDRWPAVSIACWTAMSCLLRSRMMTTSPGRTRYEGTVTRRPLTRKCPWETSWRAWARDSAKCARYTTLSRRLSRIRRRVSPV